MTRIIMQSSFVSLLRISLHISYRSLMQQPTRWIASRTSYARCINSF